MFCIWKSSTMQNLWKNWHILNVRRRHGSVQKGHVGHTRLLLQSCQINTRIIARSFSKLTRPKMKVSYTLAFNTCFVSSTSELIACNGLCQAIAALAASSVSQLSFLKGRWPMWPFFIVKDSNGNGTMWHLDGTMWHLDGTMWHLDAARTFDSLLTSCIFLYLFVSSCEQFYPCSGLY